jgi:VWFA-related protein
MTRVLIVLVVLLLPGIAGAQPPPDPAAAPIRLDVVAFDRKGAPVTDLRPTEFEVWISGYRVPIADVYLPSPAAGGRTLVLLLDDTAIGPEGAIRVKQAAKHFVEQMGAADRIAVVPLRGARLDPTSDRARLIQAIDRYYSPAVPFRPEHGSRQVLQTVTRISEQLAERVEGRKTIVAIGAPWLFDTPVPARAIVDLDADWVTAMRMMAATNTSLYVIDPGGLGPARGPGMFGGNAGFARETGGFAFLNTNDFAGAAGRVLAEAGSYYVLALPNPPVQRAAALREVNVKVLRDGVTVRARTGIKGRP